MLFSTPRSPAGEGVTMDVVIPVAAKDAANLRACVEGIVAHSLTPIRRIHVVSERVDVIEGPSLPAETVWVDERAYPFSKEAIADVLDAKGCPYRHASYYFQQLLKLYAFRAIPGLAPNALILDADYTFVGRWAFLTGDGKAILAHGYPFEWQLGTRAYPETVTHIHAQHAARLVPGWAPTSCWSGMQHHMLFQRDVMEALFAVVEATHRRPLWRAFVDTLDVSRWNAASEYVLYHHYARGAHPRRVVAEHLDACDVVHDAGAKDRLPHALDRSIDRVRFRAFGCHGFLDLRARLATMDYLTPALRARMLTSPTMTFLLTLEQGLLRVEELGA